MERKTFIYTFILGSGGLLFHGSKLNAMNIISNKTQIKMIYNNTGVCKGLQNAWGLSVWIENENGVTLFDTGGEAPILKNNLTHLGLDVNKIKQIIISHDHWDHNGGISMVLEKMEKKPDLYVTANTEKEYSKKYTDAKVIGVSEPVLISEGIWSSGSLSTEYKANGLEEQALILIRDDSMIILTGCSHPGIVKIVERVKEIHPQKKIKLVAGGFHLMRESKNNVEEISIQLKNLDIEKIAPSHCTGEDSIEIFRKNWGESFVDLNINDEISI